LSRLKPWTAAISTPSIASAARACVPLIPPAPRIPMRVNYVSGLILTFRYQT
jgi:hypothetical protein